MITGIIPVVTVLIMYFKVTNAHVYVSVGPNSGIPGENELPVLY